jgi:hypothetical protein
LAFPSPAGLLLPSLNVNTNHKEPATRKRSTRGELPHQDWPRGSRPAKVFFGSLSAMPFPRPNPKLKAHRKSAGGPRVLCRTPRTAASQNDSANIKRYANSMSWKDSAWTFAGNTSNPFKALESLTSQAF